MRKKSKTASVLMMPFLGSLLLMIALSVVSVYQFYKSSADRVYEKGDDKALATAVRLENYLDTAMSILRVTADTADYMIANDVPTDDILAWMKEETENQKEQFDENYTGLYGYIRRTYLSGSGWVPPEGYVPTDRDWYRAAKLARGSVTIAAPYLDAHTGLMVVSFCKRLNDGESVLAVDLVTNYIQSVVEETGINDCGYGFVVNKDGSVIAHKNSVLIGENLFSMSYGTGLMQRVSRMKNGHFEITMDGKESILFVHDVTDDWTLVLTASKHELFADVYTRIYFIIALFFVVFLLTALLYTLAVRKSFHEYGTPEDEPSAENEEPDVPAAPRAETEIETIYDAVGEIRLKEARKYLGSDELLKNALQSFYEQIPDKADEIERLSKEKDYENYTIQVHALKSSARLIGANELSEMARTLEECGNMILENTG